MPHTDEEIESMLEFIGVPSLDALYDMVPLALRLAGGLDLEPGLSEFEVMCEMERLAGRNRSELICFAGAGAYDHDIPAVVRRLAGRTEFVTSYTPYQPEVAQGVLQALFEYQTLISRLSGLPVSNASLYDGATALTEALNMTCSTTGRHRVLMSAGVHPNWRDTARTLAVGTQHRLTEIPLRDGVTDWSSTDIASIGDVGAVVVQYPNHLGCLDDPRAAKRIADESGAMLVVAYDPIAAGMLESAGGLGADVAVGEGQPLGTPLGFGGPYLGLFSCRRDLVRRLPGRLVGESRDTSGRRAYVTTLQAREQHIRREKASSNVCTNQTLIAVAAAIQLSWLGGSGLREIALQCARGTRYLRESLIGLDSVELVASAPTLRELAIRTDARAETVVDRMMSVGFLAGTVLREGDYGDGLVIAVTEKRTRKEIDAYVDALRKAARR